jgi:hypothetical protein
MSLRAWVLFLCFSTATLVSGAWAVNPPPSPAGPLLILPPVPYRLCAPWQPAPPPLFVE